MANRNKKNTNNSTFAFPSSIFFSQWNINLGKEVTRLSNLPTLTTHKDFKIGTPPPSGMASVFFVLVSVVPTPLMLKRTFPNHGTKLIQLREIDMQRHGRFLQSSVVNLPATGFINDG
ncbi:hypothetical protein Lal_00003487 [Lupinus albus]|nr:hypothetical protein Lal_00003487 [Lupinus albus]